MKRVCFLLSGGPDNLLSGRAKRAGGRPFVLTRLFCKLINRKERQVIPTDFGCSRSTASCDPAAAGSPGQQVVRATRKFCPHVLLFVLLLAFTTLVAHAQTDSTNAPTTTPVVTNAPDFNPAGSPVTPLTGIGNQSQPKEDIDDIRPPFFFLHSWLWLWLALGLVGVIVLLILLWNWLKPVKLLSPKTAYDLALEKLQKARALLQEGNPMPYAIMVSETVRDYLGQRFQAPSTRRTTEEFLGQMEADSTTPLAEHRDLLRYFLQSCDLVKFARYQPTHTELEEVHERAVTFVTATKPAPLPNHQNGRLP